MDALIAGIVIVTPFFVDPGDLRAADRALRLRSGQRRRRALPEAGPPRLARTSSARRSSRLDVLSRVDLGRAHGDRGRGPRGRLLAADRRPARADLGLRRRLARPGPGADHGRAVRLPVHPAGDRDRVPALRHDRQGIIAAAIAITVVYIPQYFRVVRNHDDQRPRGDTTSRRRGRSGRRDARSSAATCSATSIQNVPAIATLNAADAILTLAGLGFLGYGIQPTEAAEWGYDLQRAIDDAGAGIWWTGALPGPGDRAPGDRADAASARASTTTLNPTLRAAADSPEIPRRGPADAGPAEPRRRRAPTPSRGGRAVTRASGRSSTSATCGSGTARPAAPVRAVDGVTLRDRRRARPLGLVGESAAASRRSAAACSACCPRAPSAPARCCYEGRDIVGARAEASCASCAARSSG